jgi:hypothetical protein
MSSSFPILLRRFSEPYLLRRSLGASHRFEPPFMRGLGLTWWTLTKFSPPHKRSDDVLVDPGFAKPGVNAKDDHESPRGMPNFNLRARRGLIRSDSMPGHF